MRGPISAPRPWCFPCRPDGNRVSAQYLGIACEWHWGILSDSDQFALAEAVSRRHPRGGSVTSVNEQIWVVRHDLRNGDPNTVEETWAKDHAEVLRMDAENEAYEAARVTAGATGEPPHE